MSWNVKYPKEEVKERLWNSCFCSVGWTERRNLSREESLDSCWLWSLLFPIGSLACKGHSSATRTSYGDNGQLAPAQQDTRLWASTPDCKHRASSVPSTWSPQWTGKICTASQRHASRHDRRCGVWRSWGRRKVARECGTRSRERFLLQREHG